MPICILHIKCNITLYLCNGFKKIYNENVVVEMIKSFFTIKKAVKNQHFDTHVCLIVNTLYDGPIWTFH